MTDKPMTAEEAVEILKREAHHDMNEHPIGRDFVPEITCEVCRALAFLDGKHVYASRFKKGDECWPIWHEHGEALAVIAEPERPQEVGVMGLAEARELIAQAWCEPENEHTPMDSDIANACAKILAAAVQRERERCLKIVKEFWQIGHYGGAIIAAIRAAAEKETP